MLLLLHIVSMSLAATVFVIDDSDPETEGLITRLELAGHAVERSSDFGFYEWNFEADSYDLSSTDAVVWLDGNAAAPLSMPVSGQEALLSYVESGGGLLSFGQNGTNFLNMKHPALGELLPLRSWTTWTNATYFCVIDDDALCDGLDEDGDGLSLGGGHVSISTTDFGVPSMVYLPSWIVEPDPSAVGAVTYTSAVTSTYGDGTFVQLALWGNSYGPAWQTPWEDDSIAILVDNAVRLIAAGPPRADAGGPYEVVAGDPLTLDASGTTARNDATIAAYTWSVDGYTWDTVDPVTTYALTASWDGPQTIEVDLVVTDSNGDTSLASATVDVLNAAPVIEALSCPDSAPEGSGIAFEVVASDPEELDTIAISWLLDGVSVASGEGFVFASVDDAILNVQVVVEDDDGAVVTADCPSPVVVENVPATIVLDAAASVVVTEVYTAIPELTDPGSMDVHTWSLVGPDGAVVDAESGVVTWVPTADQVGEHTLTLSVFDGTDTSSVEWDVAVQSGDSDGDGLPDEVEVAYGMDPLDADDAGADPDGDGRTSAEEVEMGLEPFVYQGPGTPELHAPADEGRAAQPLSLSVFDAEAPLGQMLTHAFVLSTSSTLDPIGSTMEVDGLSGTDGITTWEVDADLEENTWYHWTARASDAYVSGDSMEIASFFLDTVNDPPGVPGINRPSDGAIVDEIELVVDVPRDPEGDFVSIRFYLWSGDDDLWTSDWRVPDGEIAAWIPDVEAAEGQEFCWRAEAQDDDEDDPRVGELSDEVCFSITAVNDPPTAPVIESPTDDGVVESPTPEIRVQNGVDPDGDATVHRFELDVVSTFDSDALQDAVVPSGEDGSTAWRPETALSEDTWVYARVQCADEEFESEWVTTTFFVSAQNDPPSVPVLLDPQDGMAFAEDGTLVVTNSLDPEGQAVTYDFRIQDTRDVIVLVSEGVEEEESTTQWTPGALGEGVYVWTARATDEEGISSDWAQGRTIVVGTPDMYDEPEVGGMVTDQKAAGCSCSVASAGPRMWTWSLLVMGVLFQRRRNPRF